jgi:DNA-binding CsgD family transcriptional regulator
MALSCFERSGKDLHGLYAKFDVGRTLLNLQEFINADSILRIVENKSIEIGDSTLNSLCLYRRLSCLAYMNEPDSMASLLGKYGLTIDDLSNEFGNIETKVQYYIEKNDYAKSESLLEQARLCDLSEDDSIYLFFASYRLATSQGETDKALEYYREYNSLQNTSLRSILDQPILGAQKEQYRVMAENELLKYRHARMTAILCVVIFMLILVIVLVTYHYKKKRMKEQLYESMAVAAELSDKIEDLKNQVRVQFRERHDLSNRLYSMYYDSENQDKITKQQLNVTINSLIKDYTATENVKKLDKLLNESYDGIMDRLVDPQLGLTEKELELFRYSFAGLSSKSVSVIIKESPQNIYQIKSRLLKKVRHNSEELWSKLNVIW